MAFRIKPAFLSLLVAATACSGASALKVDSFEFQTPVLVIVNTEGLNSAPSPILWAPGLCLGIKMNEYFSWSPGADFYYDYYSWDAPSGRALPTEIENRSAVVLGFIVSSPLRLTVPLGKTIRFELGAGPAFILRATFLAALSPADVPDAKPQVPLISGYFYKDFRWFYPEASLSFMYRLSATASFGVGGRVLFPLFHAWEAAARPFADELMVSAGLFARFVVGSP